MGPNDSIREWHGCVEKASPGTWPHNTGQVGHSTQFSGSLKSVSNWLNIVTYLKGDPTKSAQSQLTCRP